MKYQIKLRLWPTPYVNKINRLHVSWILGKTPNTHSQLLYTAVLWFYAMFSFYGFGKKMTGSVKGRLVGR